MENTIYELHAMQNTPYIFHCNYTTPDTEEKHNNWHENIELLFFTDGEGRVVYDTDMLDVKAGDIILVNTNCPHRVTTSSQVTFYCLIIDHAFALANGINTNRYQFERLISTPKLKELYTAFITEIDKKQTFYESALRAILLSLLTYLCRNHAREIRLSQEPIQLLNRIQLALGYIKANYKEDITLDSLAKEVGLSKYYFLREFKRVTGHTVVTYTNLIRAEKAMTLLKEGVLSVADTAYATGFSNLSYFSKTFFRIYNILPSKIKSKGKKT